MKKYYLLFTILFSLNLQAQKVQITFEDAFNFKRLTNAYAVLTTEKNITKLYKTDNNGHISIPVSGAISLSFYSENYEAYNANFTIDKDLKIKAIMSPLQYRLSNPENDIVLMDITVYDDFTGKPIENAITFFNENKIKLQSNSNGKLYLNKNDLNNYLLLKEGDSLSFSVNAKGYKTYSEGFRLSKSREIKAVFLQATHNNGIILSTELNSQKLIDKINNLAIRNSQQNRRTGCSGFPNVIKVGTSCSCNSCSSVSVMTIQNYVQKGLNDEWIAGWEMESLRSGTLPYKTYGAYYVLHPLNPNYDISNTTCKQVWDSDVSTNCVNAANDTQGIFLVTASDNIARSEYSAENNGMGAPSGEGCGDGYSGTGSSWPCISDNVCAGHSRYGHGRGMCQWGTQRWAQQYKNYQWITDHYYNPGFIFRCDSNHIHPDLTGTNNALDTGSVIPGHVVNATATIQNITQGPSDRTRIGFFLSTDQIYDANDRLLNYLFINGLDGLENRNISKALTIPTTTTDGTYYVLFVEDYQDDLSEDDESNNTQSIQLIVDSTGIVNDNFITQNIEIFPNPTNGIINISVNNNVEIASIKVFTILGQQISNVKIQSDKIDISALASGTYMIKITDIHQNNGSFKVVKL